MELGELQRAAPYFTDTEQVTYLYRLDSRRLHRNLGWGERAEGIGQVIPTGREP